MRTDDAARARTATAAGLVALGTILAFLPALGNGWIGGWDDGPFLVGNPNYRGFGPTQLRWMFSTFLGDHYQPLTWLSYACDYRLWGMNPAGYHATSLAVHAAAAALYFLLARRLLAEATGKPASALAIESAFAALLFSAHPLRVESVVWAADRRDVLAGFFFLAALLAYLRAQDKPDRRTRWLAVSCGAFALSLLSKAVGLCLPVVLLVLDWYPGRRLKTAASIRSAVIEKVPLALLAAVAAGGLAAAQSGALRPLGGDLTLERLDQAAYGLTFYLGKTLFPAGLSPFYEIPVRWDPTAPFWLLCAAMAALVTALAVRLRRESPALLAVWLCYAAILFPMLGLATASYQLAADRYSYLACLGWPLLAAAGLRRARKAAGPGALAAAAALVCLLGSLTWRQSLFWRDPLTLWTHAVEVAPDSFVAHLNLGSVLADQGRSDEALTHFQDALALNPVCVEAQEKLADIMDDPARAAEAAALRNILIVNPACVDAYGDLVTLRASRGEDLAAAEAYYRQLISLGLRRPDVSVNLEKVVAARRRRRSSGP